MPILIESSEYFNIYTPDLTHRLFFFLFTADSTDNIVVSVKIIGCISYIGLTTSNRHDSDSIFMSGCY